MDLIASTLPSHYLTDKLTIETLKQGVKFLKFTIKTEKRRQWHRFGVL